MNPAGRARLLGGAACATILCALNSFAVEGTRTPITSLRPQDIAARYGSAVVLLLAVDKSGTPRRLGSGVFVSEDGLLVTNLHVARGLDQVRVRLGSGVDRTTNTVVGYSEPHDLLILKVGGGPTPAVTLGDSDGISPGESVVVISNPEGLERSVSTGVVSGVRSRDTLRKIIQFTAPVSPGSSGGAIFNDTGSVIGIVSSQIVDGQNLNFGVPVNDVKPLLSAKGELHLADIRGESSTGPSEATQLEGVWNGVVSNFSHGVSSAIQLTFHTSGGDLSGEVLISRPLYGTGPISGAVEGNLVRFRSIGEGFTIDWKGEFAGSRITGSYTVVKEGFPQRGTWWVAK